MRLVAAVLLLAGALAPAQTPTTPREWLNQGVAAYKKAQYRDAIADFQKAVDLQPTDVNAINYLATAWMSLYVPNIDTPDNISAAQNAETQFRRVLELENNNRVALQSLASLAYQRRQFPQSRDWYGRLAAFDPNNKEAFYSLGVIAWAQVYPETQAARTRLNMRREEPGPILDPAARYDLKTRFSQIIEDGMANLNHALAIDPQYDDAMAYTNLLYRQRADLADTPALAAADIATADEWVNKALATKKVKAQASQETSPQPSATNRIRVGANVQAANLINRVEPIYPPLALQARIQGTVRFSITIDKEGKVTTVQLISGHPLLVTPAVDAVKQWTYRPTLLNGNPVEVVTQADVNFTLP